MEKQDWIYTRDLDRLVYKPWKPIINALILSIDDYIDKENNYANNLNITYVKDKYGFLRCEYSGGDDYTNNLISVVEDLSFYIKE